MRARLWPGVALVGAILVAGTSRAADRRILGRQLSIGNPTGAEADRLVSAVGREAGSDVPAISDPRVGGATLTVGASGGQDSTQSYALGAGGWSPLGSTGYIYKGPTEPDGDPVQRVIIKRTPGGVALLKIRLRGSVGTQPLDVVPPNPGNGGGFTLDVVLGDRYCVAFGGAAGGTVVRDTATLWKMVDATAEAGCPGQPVCGNGAIDGEEQCDGAALGSCTACRYDCACSSTSCGNGTVDAGEQCDGSNVPCGGNPYACPAAGLPGECTCCSYALCAYCSGCCPGYTCVPTGGPGGAGTCVPDGTCGDVGDVCGPCGVSCCPGRLCAPPNGYPGYPYDFCCLPPGGSPCYDNVHCCVGSCVGGICVGP